MSTNQTIDEAIYLRPITLDDTENIVRWRNSDEVRKNFIYQGLFTKESHEKWIHEQVETGHVIQMIICETEGDRPIGSVYVRDIDENNECGEYGVFIGETSARGKGYGNLAAELMIHIAKEAYEMKSLYLRVFEDNVAAVKSYENAGFRLNGKSEILNINGNDRKVVFMEIDLNGGN